MSRNIHELIAKMTLEEKAGLCSGLDFWQTKPIPRLGIPSILMTDGPHGLRKQRQGSDHLGILESVPATCFPSGSALACSFDRSLLKEIGHALGEECQAEHVSILLGPAVNSKRSPLCGRNFEYFSEDPFLTAEMAVSHIEGVQSEGVGTSLKHFAVNNQEHRRMSTNAIVDERTLREIYLTGFEGAIKKAQPWTVMCAYNQVNGSFCAENDVLLDTILRKEWNFKGFVVSDWGAVNERVHGIDAGLDLEMPGNGGLGDAKIIKAVQNGSLREDVLDRAVERILTIVMRAQNEQKSHADYDRLSHHHLARKAARDSMVLLKNDDHVLPLSPTQNIAVIGAFAKNPRYQGGGSSHIVPTELSDAWTALQKAVSPSVQLLYAQGYSLDHDDVDEQWIKEAQDVARQVDVAIVFVGLPERYESEGYDREHMRLPQNHNQVVEAVCQVQQNVVVILQNGSPVEMPWVDQVKGIFEAYLSGQAGGEAIVDLLMGAYSPSAKLAETFPRKLEDNPSYLTFPGEGDRTEYAEGIFVGYRYYDKKDIDPLFAFGHGLSYTNFTYYNLTVDRTRMRDDESVIVRLQVKNTGDRPGQEIVQLYVKDTVCTVKRPEKELKAFEKVMLGPGEEKTVTMTLNYRAFAFYDAKLADWRVESGEFDVLLGRSSRDIVLRTQIYVESTTAVPRHYTRNTTLGDLMADESASQRLTSLMAQVKQAGGLMDALQDAPEMAMAMMRYMPLRALVNFSQGAISEEQIDQFLQDINNLQ